MTKVEHQALASDLYDRTIDFINIEIIEMLYDKNLIQDVDDDAIHLANEIIDQFFSKQLTKNL